MAEQADAELNVDEDLEEDLIPETGEGDDQDPKEIDPELSDEDEDEIEVSFGDEATPASSEGADSKLVRQLRAEIRKRDADLAAARRPPQPEAIEVGEEPTLAEFDYDEPAYKAALVKHMAAVAKAEKAKAKGDQESKALEASYVAKFASYQTAKTALGARDFKTAETEVEAALSQVQQNAILLASKDPAKVVYALGKHPEKLKALAAIKHPIEFAAEVARMESSVKIANRRRAPEPEGTKRGSASLAPVGEDKQLAKLEAEADRTGDRTKIREYRESQKARAKA